MHHQSTVSTVAVLAGLALAGPVAAQQQTAPQQPQDHLSQCQQDLQTFAIQMEEDGYWLTGYPRTGMMGGVQPPAATAPGAGIPPATTADPQAAPGAPADPTVTADPTLPAEDQMVGPWGATGWQHQPQHDLRVLYQAAMVLDRHGHEEACATVADALGAQYQEQITHLQELGVDPSEVTAWRQSQIAGAQPAAETFTQVRVDRLIGMNVRSPDDQNFGDIGDALIDPETGAVEYVTIARGGFFGIGEDEVMVPWDQLYVTADYASFVLPTDEATLDAAPAPGIGREDVDAYWQERGAQQ